MGSGLKRKNRTYERNGHAILKALFLLNRKYRGRFTAYQVAKAAGLSRKTVYQHYPDFDSAICESENMLFDEFTRSLDDELQKLGVVKDSNARHFYATLVFMARKRDIFCTICSDDNNQGILYQMMEFLYERLEIEWLPKGMPNPAVGSERINMMIGAMVTILCDWGSGTHCNVRKGDRYIQRLLRAVKDAAENRLP